MSHAMTGVDADSAESQAASEASLVILTSGVDTGSAEPEASATRPPPALLQETTRALHFWNATFGAA